MPVRRWWSNFGGRGSVVMEMYCSSVIRESGRPLRGFSANWRSKTYLAEPDPMVIEEVSLLTAYPWRCSSLLSFSLPLSARGSGSRLSGRSGGARCRSYTTSAVEISKELRENFHGKFGENLSQDVRCPGAFFITHLFASMDHIECYGSRSQAEVITLYPSHVHNAICQAACGVDFFMDKAVNLYKNYYGSR